jgi:hypothetical protein
MLCYRLSQMDKYMWYYADSFLGSVFSKQSHPEYKLDVLSIEPTGPVLAYSYHWANRGLIRYTKSW